MKALLVHAHPEPASFTAAMRDAVADELAAGGWSVLHSDLYAMGFDPVLKAADFLEPQGTPPLSFALEQRHGHASGTLATDIATEVEKVLAADLLVLTFPLWWFGLPAILKGWVDRVFLSGPFYGGRRFYDRGPLRGKRALVATACGSREHMLQMGGVHDADLTTVLWPLLRGTLQYTGIDVLTPFAAWHVPYVDAAERAAMLEALRRRVRGLAEDTPLPMPSLDGFDAQMRPVTGDQ